MDIEICIHISRELARERSSQLFARRASSFVVLVDERIKQEQKGKNEIM